MAVLDIPVVMIPGRMNGKVILFPILRGSMTMYWRRGTQIALGLALLAGAVTLYSQLGSPSVQAGDKVEKVLQDLEWQLPNEKARLAFKDEIPIVFVTRGQNLKDWNKLPSFWNDATETVTDPETGK